MKKRRFIPVLIVLLLLGGYIVYNYVYQEHRDIQSETSQIEISANYLLERFKTNKGNDLLNKTITVTGSVSSVEDGAATIDGSVFAGFSEKNQNLKEGDRIKIKGRCIGYDDLFEIVRLDQCAIIK